MCKQVHTCTYARTHAGVDVTLPLPVLGDRGLFFAQAVRTLLR